MKTEALFENIAERIVSEIRQAKDSIYIAVAWFTNRIIFEALVQKAREGCQVRLMFSNDVINENSSINFNQLSVNSSIVYKVGDGERELMHNKFCVIDRCTILSGSYNWTNKAESNFENIVITYDGTSLAEQFIAEFKKIKNRYYPEEAIEKQEREFPVDKIIKRLEILKNYVLLEDVDELKKGTSKLKVYDFNTDIKTIIRLTDTENFGKAINAIELFINRYQQLTAWKDPEIAALKLEIKNLEYQINAFDNERVEFEKILSDFQHRHSVELGETILEILRLKKILFIEDEEKFKEAEKDEKEYRGQFELEKETEIFELNDEQKKNLKKKFRKATMLCHPDKFFNESIDIQKQAEIIFKELNEANAKNDIGKVEGLLEQLEKGILKSTKGDALSDKEILKTTIKKLRFRLKQLEKEIMGIKQSDTFQTVMSIQDWDHYFENTKQELQYELEKLRKEIS